MAVATALAAQSYVVRGAPEREGREWVEWVQCKMPLRDGGRLVLHADFGSVHVTTGPSNRLACQVRLAAYARNEKEARASFSRYQLTARPFGSDGAWIEGRLPSKLLPGRSWGVSFNLQVPARLNLDLKTQCGGISVERLDGQLRAISAGGDIRAGDITGPVHVETAGGSIELGNISQRLEARTAGGHIYTGDVKGDAILSTSGGDIMAGMVDGTVRAETAGGNIVLRSASGPVIARTAGGQIQLGQCGASVRAETQGGSIHLDGARGRVDASTGGGSIALLQLMNAVRAETGTGRILAQIEATRSTFAASRLVSSAGDVQVYLPPDLPVTIEAAINEATGHRITSDFPLKTIHAPGDYVDGSSIRGYGSLEGGGPPLDLRTALGNIEIHTVNGQALKELKQCQAAFWKNWQEHWQERQERLRAFEKQQREIQRRLEEQMRRVEQEVEKQEP
jgi:DUF4097 and DUF4098 domain-containing protein YvlB